MICYEVSGCCFGHPVVLGRSGNIMSHNCRRVESLWTYTPTLEQNKPTDTCVSWWYDI